MVPLQNDRPALPCVASSARGSGKTGEGDFLVFPVSSPAVPSIITGAVTVILLFFPGRSFPLTGCRVYLPIACLSSKIPLHGSSFLNIIVLILKSSGCIPSRTSSQPSGADTLAPWVARSE